MIGIVYFPMLGRCTEERIENQSSEEKKKGDLSYLGLKLFPIFY